mgnify:CR=1 FL=1
MRITIVASSSLYGGTINLLAHTLPRFGITTTFVNPRDPAAFFVLALQASDRSVDPSERMEKLYGRFLERDVWTHPGGLFMRRFENASPYEREDLYFAPPEGRRFAARCVRPAQPPDGLPNMCVSEFRQRGLDAQIRFSPDLLPDWERLHEGSRALIEQMAR